MQFNSMAVRAQQKTPPAQENDSRYDMEIINSNPNPASLFGDALPSLKLGSKKEQQSFESPVKKQTEPLSTSKPVARPLEFSGSKVVEEMPESFKKEIVQNNLANLKLQNRLSQISVGSNSGLGLT
jgi:hypothetical protein